jgi:hypothetical protein
VISWGKPVLRFKSAIFANFFRSNFFWKAPFSPFFANNKAPFSPHFAPRIKVPFFAKNRLDPTHSPKLDHFSPHFAPRKVQFFAIFRFAKKSADFRRISLRGKKYHFFREKNREKQARPI